MKFSSGKLIFISLAKTDFIEKKLACISASNIASYGDALWACQTFLQAQRAPVSEATSNIASNNFHSDTQDTCNDITWHVTHFAQHTIWHLIILTFFITVLRTVPTNTEVFLCSLLTRECTHAHERVIAIVDFSLGRSVGWLVGSVVNFRACAVNEF